jgi:flagellar protein FliL
MAVNRVDPGKSEGDKAPKSGPIETAPEAVAPVNGGIKAWLPLLITLVTMPALAYGITTFLLVPQLQKGLGITPSAPAVAHGSGSEKNPGKENAAQGAKREMFTMNKLLVNVAGTMGGRYLLSSFTLAGSDAAFRDKIERNEAQLRDLACGILSVKTISDLEKPTIRNLIRSELINGFNNVLGQNAVQEIYITELAIQ